MAYNLDQLYISGQDNDEAATGTGKLRIATNNNEVLGQSFKPVLSGKLNRIELFLKKVGSPTGNAWIEIHEDAADPRNAPQVGSSSTTPDVSAISTSYDYIAFDFATPITLTPGTTYWILLFANYTISSANAIVWGVDTSSPTYSDGSYGRYGNGSAAWETISTYEGLFKQYSDDATSPSASLSPSASSSASISPSASVSPSASTSLSVSPSASLSPSSSVSLSISPSASNSPSSSISTSVSSSFSSSISLSTSPSSSMSISTSPSPSTGYAFYTRGDEVVLPTDDNDLQIIYTDEEEEKTDTANNIYVGQTGAQQYMVHQFKYFVGGETIGTIYYEGKTDLAPRDSTVYLQIYNRVTHQWDTIDFNNDMPQDIDFVLEKTIRDLSDYKDAQNIVSARVYQLAI